MWKDLTMQQRSDLMRTTGIYDPKRLRQEYDAYLTKMEQVAERNYKDWGYNNADEALVHVLNDNTYDYRGFYRDNPDSEANAQTHWPDTYKTVYHPTFSNESKYSGVVDKNFNPEGRVGGFWDGDKFVPADWQIGNEYKSGGGIHIKKSHQGRLTELKKRTGKTEVELWKTGNAATRKMITFARNARKWKHPDGGYLDDIIWDQMGQWSHPGKVTGIVGDENGTDITMRGVADYLVGIDELGNVGVMEPGRDYHFEGSRVIEVPLTYQDGGLMKPFSYTAVPIVRYQSGGNIYQEAGYLNRNPEEILLSDKYKILPVQDNTYVSQIPFIPVQYRIDNVVDGNNEVADDNTMVSDSIMAIRTWAPYIHTFENPRDKGYDSVNQRYYSYPAVEGDGTYDIGDGLKISANTGLKRIYNSQTDESGKHYITKQQHDSLVMDRLGNDYHTAKETYNNYIYNKFGDVNPWDSLSYKEQAYLIDYPYNVKNGGLSTYPKLMTAVRNGDIETIKNESKRYEYKNKGKKNETKKELGRNRYIIDYINSIYNSDGSLRE